jgi:hypothetical protein
MLFNFDYSKYNIRVKSLESCTEFGASIHVFFKKVQ